MTDNIIFTAFIVAGVAFVLFAVALINDKAERCEAVGGHILNVYKGSLCVRDGLIVEDY
jgi:multisubunit Na+/H+ antiporter MnhB subunit